MIVWAQCRFQLHFLFAGFKVPVYDLLCNRVEIFANFSMLQPLDGGWVIPGMAKFLLEGWKKNFLLQAICRSKLALDS